jgi:major membrane immunogen (membrane-anchored lipoprotein)
MGRLGKKTCPIIGIYHVIDTGFNSPWKEFYEIKFKDGNIVQLMEKPK